MNPLIYLAAVGTTAASLVLWRQASLHRVQEHVKQMATEVGALRQSIHADGDSLAGARDRLRRTQGELRIARHEQARVATVQALALTPESEGWWPADRSYFYLPKRYLPQVRFRKCLLSLDELNARLTAQAKARDTQVVSVSFHSTGGSADGRFPYTYRLLEAGKLNPDMAALLEMDDSEKQRVEAVYSGLISEVHAIEASRIQRVEPPGPADTAVPGQTLVARIPDLSKEVTPLIESANERLVAILGASRAGLLGKQAERYMDEYADKLGTVPREYIRAGNMLIVQYREKWGKHQSGRTFSVPVGKSSEYGYLFGPGAPCELK